MENEAITPLRGADPAPAEVGRRMQHVLEVGGGIIVGKEDELRLALACLVASGHLLIEDLPGVGKTTLAQLLARLLGLEFNRVQFTSDLLPADIVGVSVYDRDDNRFRFHRGPVFTNVLLADEVNRATPRTQSALLEAMEERQVSVDGETHALPAPFFVIATQNPSDQIGTFALPESQLDRFLMRLSIGFPDRTAERTLLAGEDRRDMLAALKPVLEPTEVVAMQRAVARIHAADALLDYLQDLIDYTRAAAAFAAGLSPRAGIAVLRAARAWALIDGRGHVIPEDLQAVLEPVVDHRLRLRDDTARGERPGRVLLDAVPIP